MLLHFYEPSTLLACGDHKLRQRRLLRLLVQHCQDALQKELPILLFRRLLTASELAKVKEAFAHLNEVAIYPILEEA